MSFKDDASHLVPELLYWGTLLAPKLLMFQGRRLLPRPLRVDEDTGSHYVVPSAAGEKEQVISFVKGRLEEWAATKGAPSTRAEIDKEFSTVTGLNAKEWLRTVLSDSADTGNRNFFTQRFDGKQFGVYKAYYEVGQVREKATEASLLKVVTLRPSEKKPSGPTGVAGLLVRE